MSVRTNWEPRQGSAYNFCDPYQNKLDKHEAIAKVIFIYAYDLYKSNAILPDFVFAHIRNGSRCVIEVWFLWNTFTILYEY